MCDILIVGLYKLTVGNTTQCLIGLFDMPVTGVKHLTPIHREHFTTVTGNENQTIDVEYIYLWHQCSPTQLIPAQHATVAYCSQYTSSNSHTIWIGVKKLIYSIWYFSICKNYQNIIQLFENLLIFEWNLPTIAVPKRAVPKCECDSKDLTDSLWETRNVPNKKIKNRKDYAWYTFYWKLILLCFSNHWSE